MDKFNFSKGDNPIGFNDKIKEQEQKINALKINLPNDNKLWSFEDDNKVLTSLE